MTSNYYSVKIGKKPGIYRTWSECQDQVYKYKNAQFKKFTNLEDAEHYMNISPTPQPLKSLSYSSLPTADKPKQSKKRNKPPKISKPSSKKLKIDFQLPDMPGYTIVWTDGSWDPSGGIAGSGVFYGDEDPRNMAKKVPGKQTSQRAELWAIYLALTCENNPLMICTDSLWSICTITKKWNANSNLDLLQMIWDHLNIRQTDARFIKVPAHIGIYGNECADKLAKNIMRQLRSENKK